MKALSRTLSPSAGREDYHDTHLRNQLLARRSTLAMQAESSMDMKTKMGKFLGSTLAVVLPIAAALAAAGPVYFR